MKCLYLSYVGPFIWSFKIPLEFLKPIIDNVNCSRMPCIETPGSVIERQNILLARQRRNSKYMFKVKG